ncbi:MAG: AAA family ATPase [Deltaproteobacteria bacterium]|nr:AAA family ATPase [Deltaproteobacteria bacterium]
MERIAIYGKGGVGKSVVATSLSAHFGMSGKRVLHVGCDPKHDSAIRLLEPEAGDVRTILDVLGNNPHAEATTEILNIGRHGIHACEAGGPPAGLGCGGRGVARTIEYLDEVEFLEEGNYDVVIFDVLGDVVCGGFAAPLRSGFAEKVAIVVSEEPMAIFAANNIARAVVSYHRNGVVLAGLIVNLRGKDVDYSHIEHFAKEINTKILGVVQRDERIMQAEREQKTIVEFAPDSASAEGLTALAGVLQTIDVSDTPLPTPMEDGVLYEFMRTWGQ